MRSARTGKCYDGSHHCTGGGRTPRPRLPPWPQFMRGVYRRLARPARGRPATNCAVYARNGIACALKCKARGPLVDPERLAERLLRRDVFTPAPGQNILSAAWPLFYRRIVNRTADCAAPRDWWAGPALLQVLFAREHNEVYRQLADAYPKLDNRRLHAEARNVGAALLAKIHLQWRASMAPVRHWRRPLPRLHVFAEGRDNVNCKRPSSIDHLLACITPPLPDRFVVHSVVTGKHQGPRGGFGFLALHGSHAHEFIEHHSAANLWYSFGIAAAGAFELRNHCAASRRLPTANGERFDNPLATAVTRQRRSHPAAYNALRRLVHLPPLRDFDELDSRWAAEVQANYSRVDDVDGLIGMLAERRGSECMLGETTVRCLTVFDRAPYCRPALSGLGKSWVRENTLQTLLSRHYPVLQEALHGMDDPFVCWRAVAPIELL